MLHEPLVTGPVPQSILEKWELQLLDTGVPAHVACAVSKSEDSKMIPSNAIFKFMLHEGRFVFL